MSSASHSQMDSRDEAQLRSTQWLNQSQRPYSLYLRQLNEALSLSPKAPQIQTYQHNIEKYLSNQEYLNRVLNHLCGIKSNQITTQNQKEFESTLETMEKNLAETEAKIIEADRKNSAEEFVIHLILRLIAKQLETYNALGAQYNKVTSGEPKTLEQSHHIDPAQIQTVKSTKLDLALLQTIKTKMIERSKEINSAELQSTHRKKIAQREELKSNVENLIGSEVDFEDTIKLYQQRSKAVEEINRKQQEMVEIQKEIQQISLKAQTILSKTKMIELTQQSKEKQRQRSPLEILKDIENDAIPQNIRNSNVIKKIKITTKRQATNQTMLWLWAGCLIALFYFYC